VRLHPGTRFRCVGCRKEFNLEEVCPKIEHFGLTQERITLLKKKVSELSGIAGLIGSSLGLIIGVGSQVRVCRRMVLTGLRSWRIYRGHVHRDPCRQVSDIA
jgi:hypothetical protein